MAPAMLSFDIPTFYQYTGVIREHLAGTETQSLIALQRPTNHGVSFTSLLSFSDEDQSPQLER
jgi:hypothetical protein